MRCTIVTEECIHETHVLVPNYVEHASRNVAQGQLTWLSCYKNATNGTQSIQQLLCTTPTDGADYIAIELGGQLRCAERTQRIAPFEGCSESVQLGSIAQNDV